MLIDASHPEETRVVVVDGSRVEEFDFEAAAKRPLKGNIYLAKVTRVEPSLQAAFVEYGGNRQGFLAFSEIHPDYYQIPVADRMALIAEAEADARRRQEDDVESFEITSGPKPAIDEHEDEFVDADADIDGEAKSAKEIAEESDMPEAIPISSTDEGLPELETNSSASDDDEDEIFTNHPEQSDEAPEKPEESRAATKDPTLDPDGFDIKEIAAEESAQGIVDEQTIASAADIEESHEASNTDASANLATVPDLQSAAEPATETGQPTQALHAQKPPQRWMRRKHYKIQEVIKRRQVILVQVVKEERGNKGAALTTYLSLAGRYCVLMPNTPRGGGISRKITNVEDRKRLKSAAQSLELPEGMGLIIRTAGENRTKVEIKRDYEYLLRLWDTIRELTLRSNAPACVYEEGDLIKRAIRDLYNKDVSDVVVEGEEGYRNAKDFMRMLMPSHAKNVKLYKEPAPLFQRHHVEAQLDAMFSPTVTLKSGGYIVINQTEALVSIDVNSGRATREHSIEETAHKTNLEAASEIARQLRLRDLAGLIVIDFIDMEDPRNDRDVERRLRDAVKNDRARVQIGRISQFGLLEMSRQRLRAGVIAGSTVPCPHCGGQGIVRSVESTSLRLLRAIEEEGQRLRASSIVVRAAAEVAIYTLNQKRRELARVESDYGLTITFEPKEGLPAGTFDIERLALKTVEERARYAVSVEAGFSSDAIPEEGPVEEVVTEPEVEAEVETTDDGEDLIETDAGGTRPLVAESSLPADSGGRRRRRRRRGGRDRDRPRENQPLPPRPSAVLPSSDDPENIVAADAGIPAYSAQAQQAATGDANGRRRRRRRRRGRHGRGAEQFAQQPAAGATYPSGESAPHSQPDPRFGVDDEIDTTPREESPRVAPNALSSPEWSLGDAVTSAPPQTRGERHGEPDPVTERGRSAGHTEDPVATEAHEAPKKGWWQRTFRPND
jgi:ribonuclease E